MFCRLSENLITDELVNLLVIGEQSGTGLFQNNTITYLGLCVRFSPCLSLCLCLCADLSHNKIGDKGAARLAELLADQLVLTHLDLGHNAIRGEGATAIATALAGSVGLQVFSCPCPCLCASLPLFAIC